MRFEPRYAWTSLAWWSAGGAAVWLMLGGALMAATRAGWALQIGLFAALLPAGAGMTGALISGAGRRRLRRRLLAADCQLCTRCGYDLRGTPEPGPCPECGRFFSVEGVQWEWRRYLNPRPEAGERIWRWWRGEKGR